jgi:hypothetical protein
MQARWLVLVCAATLGCSGELGGSSTPEEPERVDAGKDAGSQPTKDAGLPDSAASDAGAEAEASQPEPTPTNDSVFVDQTIPSRVSVGENFTVSVTMRNIGTTTWSGGHFLGAEGPRDNEVWGTNRISLAAGASVAPGDSYTFSHSLTAPAAPGSTPMQWRMLQESVEWFGEFTSQVAVEVEDLRPDPGPEALEIVKKNRALYGTPMTQSELIECLRQIARDLNAANLPGGPFGVLVKPSGHNCEGYSCDIICSGQDAQQRQWDVFVDNENLAGPVWSEVSNIAIRPCEIL